MNVYKRLKSFKRVLMCITIIDFYLAIIIHVHHIQLRIQYSPRIDTQILQDS